MKRWMIHSMFAAAALSAVALTVNAQTLTAEIPFAFRAGTSGMSAGTYVVSIDQTAASRVVRLQNRETHATALIANYAASDPSKAWRAAGAPKLGFECHGSRCALREVWTGEGFSLRLATPKAGSGDGMQMTEIRMNRAPAF